MALSGPQWSTQVIRCPSSSRQRPPRPGTRPPSGPLAAATADGDGLAPAQGDEASRPLSKECNDHRGQLQQPRTQGLDLVLALLLVGFSALWAAPRRAVASSQKAAFSRGSTANMVAGAELQVVTLNIRGISDRWPERMPILRECLERLGADVYMFQEVLTGEFCQEHNILGDNFHIYSCRSALHHLLCLGGVAAFFAKYLQCLLGFSPTKSMMVRMPLWVESWREGWRVESSFARLLRDVAMLPFFGNSMASSINPMLISSDETLWLGDFRCAHRIAIRCRLGTSTQCGDGDEEPEAEEATVWVVNTHLHHDEEQPGVRSEQVETICRWMLELPAVTAGVIIAGDLNAHPEEETHGVFTSFGYKSAYASVHGADPEVTWPSGIEAPLKDEGPPMCLDYIYLRSANGYRLTPMAAELVATEPCPSDSTLYPSDHLGIQVRLGISRPEPPPDSPS